MENKCNIIAEVNLIKVNKAAKKVFTSLYHIPYIPL